jgi:hypothetical protein
VELVDKDRYNSFKGATPALNKNGGTLNHSDEVEEQESRIDKLNSLRVPPAEEELVKDAAPIKDASVPALENSGTLKGCGHGYQGGKGCYLCDSEHPYRKKEDHS